MFSGHKIGLMEKDCAISNVNILPCWYLNILYKLIYFPKERFFSKEIVQATGNTKCSLVVSLCGLVFHPIDPAVASPMQCNTSLLMI